MIKVKYSVKFFIAVAILALFYGPGLSFGSQIEMDLQNDLSSIGEAASQDNPEKLYIDAAENYANEETANEAAQITYFTYGAAKNLKPILISYYISPNNHKLRSKYKQLSARSGRLTHKVTVDIAPLIEKYAEKHSVDPYLIRAIMKTESNFRPYAVSPCGAVGLMQLMPETARSLGVRDFFDPEQNIEAGTKYIKGLLLRLKSTTLAIAAYNAGPYSVLKHNGVPPYYETRRFVQKVTKHYNER